MHYIKSLAANTNIILVYVLQCTFRCIELYSSTEGANCGISSDHFEKQQPGLASILCVHSWISAGVHVDGWRVLRHSTLGRRPWLTNLKGTTTVFIGLLNNSLPVATPVQQRNLYFYWKFLPRRKDLILCQFLFKCLIFYFAL